MKRIIDIPDEVFNIFKKHGIMAFDYLNEYDKDTIARIIAHGTTYNPTGDCISREAVKANMKKADEQADTFEMLVELYEQIIDNAQAITLPNNQVAWEQGYEAGLAQGKQDKMSDNKSLCDTCLYGHCCESSDAGISWANHSVCHGYVADVIDENVKGDAE